MCAATTLTSWRGISHANFEVRGGPDLRGVLSNLPEGGAQWSVRDEDIV
jgi:hypothetical protein